MKIHLSPSSDEAAFTFPEMLMTLAITLITMGGTVSGFLQSANQAEWSAYSLAAQSQAMRGIEQARAAKWDPRGYPAVDEVVSTNFPVFVDVLDVPMPGGNITYATNRVTITQISTNPRLKMIRVDCTWKFMNRGVFTNTVFTYRAPDQ